MGGQSTHAQMAGEGGGERKEKEGRRGKGTKSQSGCKNMMEKCLFKRPQARLAGYLPSIVIFLITEWITSRLQTADHLNELTNTEKSLICPGFPLT